MTERAAWDVMIIGAGMAGLSTAIWTRRLGLSTLVLEQAGTAGGQLAAIAIPLADFPGLAGTAGPDLASRLIRQAEEAGAVVRLAAGVTAITVDTLTCTTGDGQVTGRALVIATGLAPRRLGVPGEEHLMARGFVRRPSRWPDWFHGKRVAVIGGGDRAAENALLLARSARAVHLIHRQAELRARAPFQEALRAAPEVIHHLESTVTGFRYPEQGGVTVDLVSPAGLVPLAVDAVCIYVGNQPNTGLLAGQVALAPDGTLETDRDGQTSAPGVFAVGDVATPPHYQSLATAAGQAMVVAKRIALSHPPS